MQKILKKNNNFLLIRNLWKYISFKNRKIVYKSFLLMLTSGLCEVFSLAALIPFLNILTNSENYINNKVFVFFVNLLNISQSESNLFILITIFLGLQLSYQVV